MSRTRQLENQDKQRRQSKRNNNHDKKTSGKLTTPKTAVVSSESGSATKGKTFKKGRVNDTDTCPVHPGGNHKWGECIANAYNTNLNKQLEKRRKSKDQVNVAKEKAIKKPKKANASVATISTLTPATIEIDNEVLNDIEDDGTFEQQQNCSAVTTDNVDVTHHFDALSFIAVEHPWQTNKEWTNPTKGEVLMALASSCEDAYLNGDGDLTLLVEEDLLRPLKL